MFVEDYVAQKRGWLLRVATVLCGDGALAEDLVQTVLTKAFQRWDRVQSADVPDAYVRRMLVNEYLTWRRKAVRTAAMRDLDDLLPPSGDHAEPYVERVTLLSHVLRLPRKQRATLVLRYYEGLDDDEIAETLGCSRSTVRSNVARALATLHVALNVPEPNPMEAGYELHRG